MKNLKKTIDNIKLKSKMTFVWVFSVILILILVFCGDYKIINAYNDALYSVMVDSMNYALTEISIQLSNYEILSESIYRNTQIQNKLCEIRDSQKLYTSDYTYIRQLLISEVSQCNYVNYVVLIDETTGTVFPNTTTVLISSEKKEKILNLAGNSKGKFCWITEYGKESQMILARKIPCIENLGKDNLATLIINIDIAALIRDTGVSEQETFHCVLVDQEGNSLSDSGDYTNEQINNIYDQISNEKYAVVNMNGARYFAVYREEKAENWGYIFFSDYNKIYSSINMNIYMLFFIGVICVIFIVCLNSLFTKDILNGFKDLIQEFQDFSETISSRKSSTYSERKDEIGILYQQFELMQDRVVQLIEKNYVIELERKQAQVEMLETQINPHFLYNTLQTINWRAKALRSKEISIMVESLSQILQSTLSNKKSLITVEQELDLTQQFVNIQKLRMDGELKYEVDVDFDLLTATIPKLIIQPLVENGILHSMNAMVTVPHILVKIKRTETELIVFVKNNGSMFPENLLLKLNNKEIQPTGHGIGIMNIDTRIKLTYGEKYGINFYNEKEYAVAELKMPYDTEGERYV